MTTETYLIDAVKVKTLMLTRWRTAEQKLLAEHAGISLPTMSRILNGYSFSSESLYALCKALECTPNDILMIGPKGQTLAGVAA